MTVPSWASSDAARRSMQSNRSRDTAPEVALRRNLHARGLRYRVAYRPVDGLRRTADIVFTRARVAVFVDGCFWHGCPEHYRAPARNADYWAPKVARNRARDTDTTAQLVAAGWTVLRFWEHEDVGKVADMVEAVVRKSAVGSAGRFTLDALEADATDDGTVAASWAAVRFGAPWNGWATPVVTRDVLASILETVSAATGEPHRWDGTVAVISGPVDEPGAEPEYEDRVEADNAGLYDLGVLGWTWVRST